MNLLLAILFLTTLEANALRVLIDPGHGGQDKGAARVHRHNKKKLRVAEKDLTLQISKKIYQKIRKKHSAYLTRSVDRTITLEERAELSDKLNIDLVISVHINSSASSKSRGFETYYLDNHGDVAVKKVEDVENIIAKGNEAIVHHILTDLVIQKTVTKSKRFAQMVHTRISKGIRRKFKMVDRGVKPGLFFVLALSKRPGVLLEVGFISNPLEAMKMRSPKFQDRYAQAVADAIDEYAKTEGEVPTLLPLF